MSESLHEMYKRIYALNKKTALPYFHFSSSRHDYWYLQSMKWTKKTLQTSTIKSEILNALEYFEFWDCVGFLKVMDQLPAFSGRETAIGELVWDHSDDFPYLTSALCAVTAAGFYFTEPFPSGIWHSMAHYIARDPFKKEDVARYFLKKWNHTFRFVDEERYWYNTPQDDHLEYFPEKDTYASEVMQQFKNWSIKLKVISFYGIEFQQTPDYLTDPYFKNTSIQLIDCSPASVSSPYKNIQKMSKVSPKKTDSTP